MEPPVPDQLTAVLLDPDTVAVNCCEPPACSVVEDGLIATETTGALLTVTVADADFEVSATLVAVTVKVPLEEGAV
jgi:hypothetical protein